MPRPRKQIPVPRQHKGAEVVDVYIDGRRRQVTLGPAGSEQARQEYARIVAEGGAGRKPDITINEMTSAFLKWADGFYLRADGTATHEVLEYEIVAKLLRELYGHTLATEFGPLALKAVRSQMVARGWCRSLINRRVGRIRRIFKWSAAEESIPFEAFQRLTAVEGLKRGRGVRDSDPVKPVSEEHVRATLLHVPRPIRAMIELQLYTGCRPDEICRIRPCEIDRTDEVWVYRPQEHKNTHRGKPRAIAIGPRAQAILREFEPVDPREYYFSPHQSVHHFHAIRSAQRITPRFPSHMLRNKLKRALTPRRPPAERYTTTSYRGAIFRGIRSLNAEYIEAAVEMELHIPNWSPNQIRHAVATSVRRRFGVEAAGATLGHDQLSTTEIYAEKNLALAIRIAREVG